MTLPLFKDYDPSNPWTVTNETHTVAANGTVRLVYAPKKGSITISGFAETQNPAPGLTEFYCDYQDVTNYRTAQQILYFSASQAGNTVAVSYQGVSQTIMAEHLNELKAHEENAGIHLSNNSATDAIIGNRTVNQGIADAAANTGTLTQILSWFAQAIKGIKGTTNWYDSAATTLATLWGLKWTQGVIITNPADAYTSPAVPFARNGTMATIDFIITGTPSAATTITAKVNGTALAPTVSLSAAGKTTLTLSTPANVNADDLFSFSVAGAGLAACTVVCNGKLVNR